MSADDVLIVRKLLNEAESTSLLAVTATKEFSKILGRDSDDGELRLALSNYPAESIYIATASDTKDPVGFCVVDNSSMDEWRISMLAADSVSNCAASALIRNVEHLARSSNAAVLATFSSSGADVVLKRHGFLRGDTEHGFRKRLRNRVVWLSGNSGAGKTFTGDYLARCAGFHHVDGDAFAFSPDANDRELFARLVKAFDFWFEDKSAPADLWQPYLLLLCERAKEAVQFGRHDVVISHTVYHREARDFLRLNLPDHIFILLRCSQEELIRRARIRFSAYAESQGKSFAIAFEDANKLERGAFTDALFIERTLSIMRGLQPFEEDEMKLACFEIDVSDGKPWQAIHDILGLRAPPEHIPVQEIAQVNYERFKQLSTTK